MRLRARLRSDGVIPGRWCFVVRVPPGHRLGKSLNTLALGSIYRQTGDILDEQEAVQVTNRLESAGYEVERID